VQNSLHVAPKMHARGVKKYFQVSPMLCAWSMKKNLHVALEMHAWEYLHVALEMHGWDMHKSLQIENLSLVVDLLLDLSCQYPT
jgi:hypothetical protein